MPVSVHGKVQLRPARGDLQVRGAARFDLVVMARQYLGSEESVTLIDGAKILFDVLEPSLGRTSLPGASL
jgi:hypothetical protein